jgi:hypothetical protein
MQVTDSNALIVSSEGSGTGPRGHALSVALRAVQSYFTLRSEREIEVEWINLPFVQGGAVVVLLAGIWLIMTGRLVPRGTVDSLREGDKMTIERQREEITEWRTAWIAADLAKRELSRQVGELAETGKITVQLLQSVTEDKRS